MATPTFHIVMFPWFATGHISPFLHLSNKLAEKGYRVSFLIPCGTQNKFTHLNLYPNLFQFIPLTIPHVDGLPVGAETMSDVGINSSILAPAFDLTQDQVEIALHKLKPDFVFFDFAYWVPTLARPLGIKCIHICTLSVVSCAEFVRKGVENKLGSTQLEYEAKTLVQDGRISLEDRNNTSMRESDALCFRGCIEMEGPFVDYLEGHYNKKVLLIGQLLTVQSHIPLEERWANWLGGFNTGTVVYCSFGSECVLDKDQFQELVLGLELTGLPFLVRLRPPNGVRTVEEALPEGFEERVKGRGIVHGDWVQQQHILCHPSVGCFLGHSGTGSMWESLMSTCQIVLAPHYGDQFVNTMFMTKELEVAVAVERRPEDGGVTRESVCKAVKLVMDQGNGVGEEVRANHRKWKDFLLCKDLELSYTNKLITNLHCMLK